MSSSPQTSNLHAIRCRPPLASTSSRDLVFSKTPVYAECFGTDSPVSQLARNLGELSTSSQHRFMPRRKLSLGGCTPGSAVSSRTCHTPGSTHGSFAKQLSVDEGCSVESPGVSFVDSPFSQERFGNLLSVAAGFDGNSAANCLEKKESKMKRFKTLPLTFYGFSATPPSKPSVFVGNPIGRDHENMLTAESDGEEEKDESSQDSGVGLDFKVPTVTGSKVAQSPGLSILRDGTNLLDRFVINGQKRSGVKSLLQRSMSVPGKETDVMPLSSLVIPSRLATRRPSIIGRPTMTLSTVMDDDDDDGFVELNDPILDDITPCSTGRELTAAADSSILRMFSRKRRRPSNENDRTSCLKRSLSHVETSPCLMNLRGIETPTSSKALCGAVKRARESIESGSELPTVEVFPTPVAVDRTNVQFAVPRSSSARRLMRCHSEAVIHSALSTSEDHPNLIGDFSRPYSLPLIVGGKHQDLKAITPETMSQVLNSGFSDFGNYVIVDCRYPYEYEGGHLMGAKNIYTKEGIIEEFLSNPKNSKDSPAPTEKKIVIFHCEFSSERGPKLMRFLRNKDRDGHRNCYPALQYPECYLLEGGYKAFFENHSHLCKPCGYRTMVDPDHAADLKHFRSKSRSWPASGTDDAARHGRRARSCLKL